MKRYESLNGLRAYAAIGIVLMHVRANIDVNVTGNFLYNHIIPAMSDFVFLFMMVSAFSLCCGYYNRFKNRTVSLNEFYTKRYSRILPFFAILVVLSVFLPHSPNKTAIARAATSFSGPSGLSPIIESIIEGLTEFTLVYGLLPNSSLSVMGVGWFLGVIFLFYLLFPFFVFIMDNKRRAWFSFLIIHLLCYFCIIYYYSEKFVSFQTIPRHFLYNTPFFAIGGLLFLYKSDLECVFDSRLRKLLLLLVCIGIMIGYWMCSGIKFTYSGVIIKSCAMGSWLIYAIVSQTKVLHNKVIDYISDISMEVYLCHMLCFRVVQSLCLSNYIDNVHVCYLITCLLTLSVAIVFSHVVKYWVLPKIGLLMSKFF